jgi:hypothetical protein
MAVQGHLTAGRQVLHPHGEGRGSGRAGLDQDLDRPLLTVLAEPERLALAVPNHVSHR